ncbi:MAG: 2-keto-4-pentenoate hydratase [Alphaproteobacteria bacterium]|jgi:2-keto-4-pentenoate hydratase
MTPESTANAAAAMIAARDTGGPCPRLDGDQRPQDQAEGYAIQDAIIAQRLDSGEALGGWKIGCTTATMQEMLGIDSPAGGAVMGGNVLTSPAEIPASTTHNPVVECEIGVRIASDVPAREGGHDANSIGEHVATCFAAIELAEMRYAERDIMGVPEFIADDFFQRGVVVGPEVADWRNVDLLSARGTTTIAGDYKGEGFGRDVMGHPFAALAWLANALHDRGHQLLAGQVVLTGSLVPAMPIARGETAVCDVMGLGGARLTLL